MSDTELLDGWVAAVAVLSPEVDGSVAHRAGVELLGRWGEPHRSYHTQQHLAEMLSAIDELGPGSGLGSRETLLAHVAAWLHDAVYDVQAPSGESERKSARMARNLLASLQFDGADRQVVEELILLTIDHGTQLPGPLADVFTDADLAILAALEARFDEYCAQVRAEYAHVPDAAYATGRSEILAALVERPEVYRTRFARTAWTAAARANVRREMDRLSASSG
ncbi:MAG TPA: hypothetical protein VG502_01345 [Flexivirga sp.]|uniref:HD domain-containing protein n=1 Tax=Flexivirga sp. TaxID=1962927 RepID=UPI002BFD10D5|nr:hypothetical protein [Flexivirga sp.]HWC20919.1 hypothetical protein [Flexivirga sp.]